MKNTRLYYQNAYSPTNGMFSILVLKPDYNSMSFDAMNPCVASASIPMILSVYI